MRLVFDLAFIVYAIFYIPYMLLRKRKDPYWAERWGFYSSESTQALRSAAGCVWLHAVSVGEVRLAALLSHRILNESPDTKIILTVTTPTGRSLAESLVRGKNITVIGFPLDASFIVGKFIDLCRPTVAVFMETELWPNTFAMLHKKGAKIILSNARISDKAFPKYKKIKKIMEGVLKNVHRCLAQSEVHARRYRELGVCGNKVVVAGNLKYDLPKLEENEDLVRAVKRFAQGRFIFLAASTHPLEEVQIADALKEAGGSPCLVIAPRHPERSKELIKQLAVYSPILLSSWESGAIAQSNGILIVDRMGLMGSLYRAASHVFIGGSLVPIGGHNIAEAAAFGCSLSCGPYMNNFSEMTEVFLKENGLRQVRSASELAVWVKNLQESSASRQENAGAQAALAKLRGASQKTIKEIMDANN